MAPRPSTANTLLICFGNREQLAADQNKVWDYVKDELFQRLVFVWTKASLAERQFLHADFLKSCKLKIADGMLENAMEQEAAHYMNMLWAAFGEGGLLQLLAEPEALE